MIANNTMQHSNAPEKTHAVTPLASRMRMFDAWLVGNSQTRANPHVKNAPK